MNAHSILLVLNYISIGVIFISCIVINKQNGSRMQKITLLISICLLMCSIGFIFRNQATDIGGYMAGQVLAYTFVIHALFLVLLFVLEYCKYDIPAFIKNVFHVLNCLVSLAVLTINYHPFFYKKIWGYQQNGLFIVDKEYGIIHTLALILLAIYMTSYITVAIIFSVKNIKKRRRYVWRILVVALLPCIAYLIPKISGSYNDFQNIAWAAFVLLLLYLIYQNNLYDVDNIAAKLSIESMEEAFIVFDDKYHFMGCNQVAYKLFPSLKVVDIDSDIREYDDSFVSFIAGETTEFRNGSEIYNVSVRSIVDSAVTHGIVIKLDDVTVQRQYTELLEEHKKQIDKDLNMAKRIQLSVLPSVEQVFSDESKFDVAAYMLTAKEVGGDFYDFYMLDENRAAFLIADVSGKGVPAAMFMMQAKAAIKSFAEEGLAVDEIIKQANIRLCEGNDEGMFVTAWMGILDIKTGLMSFANAGHNKPIVIRADGSGEYLKCKSGLMLAATDVTKYTLEELQLNPGDRLLLYTDGVTEATDSNYKLYGDNRLLELMKSKLSLSVDELLPAVKSDIDAFVGEAEQFDDITMLVVDYK